jgi:hypothetical protein
MILWLHFFRPRSGWYGLGAADRERLEAGWRTAADQAAGAGAEALGEYSVRGQSTQERVQIWRFPDVERLEAFWTALLERGYLDWRDSENVVGVPEIPFAGAAG